MLDSLYQEFQIMLARLILVQPGRIGRECSSLLRTGAGYHTSAPLAGSWDYLQKRRPMSSLKLQKKDGVPEDYKMIYRMGIESYIEPTGYIGFGASIVSVGLLPWILMNQNHLVGMPFIGNLPLSGTWEAVIIWGFIVNHALAGYYVGYKVPIRMYFSEKSDNFIIVMNHFLPWKKSLFTVESGDVEPQFKRRDIYHMNNYRHVIQSKGRRLYLGYNYFLNGFYYKKLLGIHSEEYED